MLLHPAVKQMKYSFSLWYCSFYGRGFAFVPRDYPMVSCYSQRCPGPGDSCFLDARVAEGSLGAGLVLSSSKSFAVDVSSVFSDCCL